MLKLGQFADRAIMRRHRRALHLACLAIKLSAWKIAYPTVLALVALNPRLIAAPHPLRMIQVQKATQAWTSRQSSDHRGRLHGSQNPHPRQQEAGSTHTQVGVRMRRPQARCGCRHWQRLKTRPFRVFPLCRSTSPSVLLTGKVARAVGRNPHSYLCSLHPPVLASMDGSQSTGVRPRLKLGRAHRVANRIFGGGVGANRIGHQRRTSPPQALRRFQTQLV